MANDLSVILKIMALFDGYQRGLSSMICKFFDKESTGSSANFMSIQLQLGNEYHKSVIKKFQKRKSLFFV